MKRIKTEAIFLSDLLIRRMKLSLAKLYKILILIFPAIQDSVKSELDRESSVRADAETRLREVEGALRSQQAKAKQLTHALQKQVEEQSNARVGLCQMLTLNTPFYTF